MGIFIKQNSSLTALKVLFWLSVIAGLYILSLYNYLLFHSLAELFSVAIAAGVFFVAWNARRVIQNNYLTLLGISFLFVGVFDVLHTLSYKGMGVFPGYGANLPTQLWIASRYIGSITFLIAPLFIARGLNHKMTMGGYTLVSGMLIISIFSGAFPDCFIEGQGLTAFKKYSEYLISAILIGSIVLLHRNRDAFSPQVLHLLQAALILTIMSELSFTFYVSVYGLSNLVGHYFKILAFYLIYRTLVETGLTRPFELLFRDLKQSEQKYQSLFTRMIDGFAYHKIVTDGQGNPVDYIFLEVNDAFERLTGLKRTALLGKRVTEAIPGIEKDPADWIGMYGKVALEGQEMRFEQFSASLDRWYSVSAYSTEPGYFAAAFEDITSRKKAEDQLKEYAEELTKYSQVLEKNNVELQNLVNEKEMLMKEVHHRVKNNFLIVYSLLRFQAMHVKDSVSREMFKESQDRVRAMSLLHEKLHQSDDMEYVDFANFIETLSHKLVSSYQVTPDTVTLNVDVPKIKLDVDLMVPCGLIVNELITNALKYAFPDGRRGEICILGNLDENSRCTLSVKDTGVGLPEGFKTGKGGTLGMELVDMLVKQLDGTIEVVNRNGVEFRIGFDTQRYPNVNQN